MCMNDQTCVYCDEPINGMAYFVGGQPMHPTCAHEYGAELDQCDEPDYDPRDYLPGDDDDYGYDDDYDYYDDYDYGDEYQSYYAEDQALDM